VFSRPWVLVETEAVAGVGANGGVPAKGLALAGYARGMLVKNTLQSEEVSQQPDSTRAKPRWRIDN